MAKRLDNFTAPFQHSQIPFLLLEVLTNGAGEMVDLRCRYANSPAAALLNTPAEALRGRRFTQSYPAEGLAQLRPLQTVAFSGSAAALTYTTVLGQTLTLVCYQPMYGLAACILEPRREDARNPGELLAELLPGAAVTLELSREGVRCLSFDRRLCQLTRRTHRELLDDTGGSLAALTDPADWPALLQELLDAARDRRAVDHDFRLLEKGGGSRWVTLRAQVLSVQDRRTTFYALLLDIDRQRRAKLRLEETCRQLESARAQLDQLFSALPGGGCLLRLSGSGGPESLRITPALTALLGESEADLAAHLKSDLLWRVLPADREELVAAAVRARAAGTPLRHLCRVRPRSGGILWLSLEAVWQPQADGGVLLYIGCSDVTAAKEAEQALLVQSQLCGLLLDRASVLSFDYDPTGDLAQIEGCDTGGRRLSQTVPNYLETLPQNATIHPDDRRKLAIAIRRAVSRGSAQALEFRGEFDGQGWRWYRATWASLFDGQGNVYRLLGKAEDIGVQKAAAERFRFLTAHQRKLPRETLAAARLDLSADRLLDARGSERIKTLLFGNSVSACVRHLSQALPDAEERRQFCALLDREPLLEAYRRGESHFGLEHRFLADSGAVIHVRTVLELAEDPEGRQVDAFLSIRDVDAARQRTAALETLVRRTWDFVLTIDAASGVCRFLTGQPPQLPAETRYRALLVRALGAESPTRRQLADRRSLRLDAVLRQLETAEIWTYPCLLGAGDAAQPVRLQWSWLDRERGLLMLSGLCTGESAPGLSP